MKSLQVDIQKYLEERGWDKLRPGDLAKSINIEAAELLELFQWSNPTLEETKVNNEKMTELKKELADVLIYCLDMATLLEIDAEEIVKHKLDHISKKYPAEVMKSLKDKEPGTDDTYLSIKKHYRKHGLS